MNRPTPPTDSDVTSSISRRGRAAIKFRLFARTWLPSVMFGVAILEIWEIGLWLINPERFALPRPSDIALTLSENWSVIFAATRVTGFVIVSGLVGGVVLGVVMSFLVARFRAADETLTPLAAAISAIPIIALAPLFNNWLGITSSRSNQAVVVLMVFFPIFVNTTKGLTQVATEQVELMRSYASSAWRTLRTVRIPNALAYFFSALRIATSLAVMAAILAEFFGGRQDTLGNYISQNAQFTRYEEAWAGVVAGSATGLILYYGVALLERFVAPWAKFLRG